MTIVWVFLMLMNGHMVEVGGFQSEESCDTTRKEIVIQRAKLGYGGEEKNAHTREYILTSYFETSKCFKVWK